MTMELIQKDCFKKIKRKYGREFVLRIRALKTDPSLKASDVAREFGISREYVRQICEELYGKGFLKNRFEIIALKCLQKMTPSISEEELETLRRSRYRRKMLEKILNTDKEALFVKVKKRVIEKLLSMGMEVIPFRRDLFIVNGWLVNIRIATKTKPSMTGRTKGYYSFGNLNSSEPDFFVFVCGSDELCYVIPAECLAGRKSLSLPVGENNGYSLFKERWEWLSENENLKQTRHP